MKIVNQSQLKIVIFTAVKYRCMLHAHVFVMELSLTSAQADRSLHLPQENVLDSEASS